MEKSIHPVLAIYPRSGPDAALEKIKAHPQDGPFTFDLSRCQITPQNFLRWTPSLTRSFADQSPEIKFRFHASVRLGNYTYETPRDAWFDLSRFINNRKQGVRYFEALSACNQVLGSPTYTFHTGLRPRGSRASIAALKDAFDQIQSIMECPCAVETLYPVASRPGMNWIDCWEEHEALLNSGVPFVLDMSHLNIISHHQGRNDDLVKAMLAAPQLTEIHVSGNDGVRDSHTSLASSIDQWWWPLVHGYTGPAPIFSEGGLAQ
jgi:hypothetical protein